VWFNFTMQLSLPAVTRMLTITHNLRSQAHFRHTLSTRVQVSVHHIGQQVIKHILFVNFIQFQYILSLSSTIKLLAIYSNPTPKIRCIAGMPSPSVHSWDQCKHETRKLRKETFIWLMSLCYIFMQSELHWWQIFHNVVLVRIYWSTADNFFWL
jgi:hypothetical protein